ncbi:hypothetical protein BRC19_01535 [Candidatus Saccharibacteria bacterium QS_5_54_17]|nr:MAG: hypothetical protein BRC19_01535 [Candidatus Saccharibacteria bacterium QS_5_54_17]
MQKRIQALFSITAVATMGFAGYIALSSIVPLNTNLGTASGMSNNVTSPMDSTLLSVDSVQAQGGFDSGPDDSGGDSNDGSGASDGSSGECGENEVEVSVEVGGNRCVQNSENSLENNAIVVYLRYLIQFLTAGVGLVITIMIVVGGFQYITAGENSQKVQAAKQKIFNAVLALILFILMYALLNYLVPVDIL